MYKTHKRKVTPQNFKKIKGMLARQSIASTVRETGFSRSTIHYIDKAADYRAYRKTIDELKEVYRKRQQDKITEPEVVDLDQSKKTVTAKSFAESVPATCLVSQEFIDNYDEMWSELEKLKASEKLSIGAKLGIWAFVLLSVVTLWGLVLLTIVVLR